MDWTPALLTRLLRCRTVLLAGAGGGFDVYGGLPLGVFLAARGVRVHYANLSFVDHAVLAACADEAGIGVVGADTAGPAGYFPERSLARWLGRRGWEPVVHAFPSTGAAPLRERYRHLVERLGLDAVVLVDGGTDILLRGDEELLGTPEEDAASLAAVAGVDTLAERFVVSIGFGVDAHHGVSHVHVLENIAELDAKRRLPRGVLDSGPLRRGRRLPRGGPGRGARDPSAQQHRQRPDRRGAVRRRR
ncbi:DUF1152 domain-containing protein [Nocardia thailandica]|uniref:DUF1152 domain-containing protein n=1 Tax=Nocardia thailandica TaxID=257275 RepID=UPI00030D8D1D|nr:DUF1152 domain-containing protein [Nocardia thailandica]